VSKPKTTPATQTTRLLLADDHGVVLEGLRAMLDQEPDLEVVGLARDGRTALEMVRELKPHVVVMDITMPDLNGIEATTQLVRDHPNCRVVALSTHTEARFIRAMLEAGASAYVTKQMAGEELLRAVRQVQRGFKYLSSDITDMVVEGCVHPAGKTPSAMNKLGSRERQVLQMIAEGRTSGEVAARLHIATNTVDTHRRNIMRKLNLRTVADLTKYAIREGLTGLDR
jgi:two-component system NarL family response regulator